MQCSAVSLGVFGGGLLLLECVRPRIYLICPCHIIPPMLWIYAMPSHAVYYTKPYSIIHDTTAVYSPTRGWWVCGLSHCTVRVNIRTARIQKHREIGWLAADKTAARLLDPAYHSFSHIAVYRTYMSRTCTYVGAQPARVWSTM